jgi:hypothetical protein
VATGRLWLEPVERSRSAEPVGKFCCSRSEILCSRSENVVAAGRAGVIYTLVWDIACILTMALLLYFYKRVGGTLPVRTCLSEKSLAGGGGGGGGAMGEQSTEGGEGGERVASPHRHVIFFLAVFGKKALRQVQYSSFSLPPSLRASLSASSVRRGWRGRRFMRSYLWVSVGCCLNVV